MIGAMMIMNGTWNKAGVYNIEEFDPDPFMEALNKNPLAGVAGWGETYMGATIASVLNGYEDPRISIYYNPATLAACLARSTAFDAAIEDGKLNIIGIILFEGLLIYICHSRVSSALSRCGQLCARSLV